MSAWAVTLLEVVTVKMLPEDASPTVPDLILCQSIKEVTDGAAGTGVGGGTMDFVLFDLTTCQLSQFCQRR
jgi:hypothetical protein